MCLDPASFEKTGWSPLVTSPELGGQGGVGREAGVAVHVAGGAEGLYLHT